MKNVFVKKAYTLTGSVYTNFNCVMIEDISPATGFNRVKDYNYTFVANTKNSNTPRKAERARFYIYNKSDITGVNSESDIFSEQGEIVEEKNEQTDEEMWEWICDVFDSITQLSYAASKLKIRALIVSGSPGTGKTYEVLKALKEESQNNLNFYYNIIKGTISPIALYIELYRARHGVLVLDDTDEAFTDSESLQILKAATESERTRLVSYRKLSSALEAEGIPSSFEFSGCVVILTNTNLEKARTTKAPHYDAIISRAHYINAVLDSDRAKLMRIRHVVETSGILNKFLEKEKQQSVIDFINENHHKFRELSIRTVVKLAELREAFSEKWERLARGTLLNSGK